MKKIPVFSITIILFLNIYAYIFFGLTFSFYILNHIVYLGTYIFMILNLCKLFAGEYGIFKIVISILFSLITGFCLIPVSFIYLQSFPNNPTEVLSYNIDSNKNDVLVLRISNDDYYGLVYEKKYLYGFIKQTIYRKSFTFFK